MLVAVIINHVLCKLYMRPFVNVIRYKISSYSHVGVNALNSAVERIRYVVSWIKYAPPLFNMLKLKVRVIVCWCVMKVDPQ